VHSTPPTGCCDACARPNPPTDPLTGYITRPSPTRYQCGLCDKKFTQVGNHRSHVRRHLIRHCFKKANGGTESGECLLCSKWLPTVEEMNKHTKSHTSEADVMRLRQLK
jgi:hypothetical protein